MDGLGKGAQGYWCLIDVTGVVAHVSTGMAQYLDMPSVALKSLFQFNPEWSYLVWQDILNDLSTKSTTELDGKVLKSDGAIEACKILLTPFILNGKKWVHYNLRVEALEKEKSSPTTSSVTTKNLQSDSPNFNYDDHSSNPVLYFESSGQITFANKKIKGVLGDDILEMKIDQLFLETDIGPLAEGVRKLFPPHRQVIMRMILKGNPGMMEGNARISYHELSNQPSFYRLEFGIRSELHYINQPVEQALSELDLLKREVEGTRTNLLNEQLDDFSFENIITKSPKYKNVLRQIAQVADTDTTVLITGETGTGKELLANATYKLSDRSDKIFVKVNCASIPKELVESILFGHEKGSFTGADSQKIGKFELADGGTIFLDEIGEMPLDLQPKLLRVLQEGEIERIGNPKPLKVDVRIIAATNRNLEKMSKKGKFRSDLYYRLNVFPIYNIPLKERLEDVPLLISHFLNKMNIKTGRGVTKIKNKDLAVLSNYHYPGNVRELENIIERSVILSNNEELNLEFFYKGENSNSGSGVFTSLDDMIKQHLQKALQITKGKVTGEGSASELLRLNGKTFASKLRKYNIDPKTYKQ